MNILVTGGLGWMAQFIVKALSGKGHRLTVLDLPGVPVPPAYNRHVNRVVQGSVADEIATLDAMQGVDAVVHLAVAIEDGDYASATIPFETNVRGTYNVLEAARSLGVRKVVLMSEAAVHVDYAEDEVVLAASPLLTAKLPRREHLYDLTKYLQECIAQDYARNRELDVVVLRPGHVVNSHAWLDPNGESLDELHYLRGGWVCVYDLAAAVVQAVTLDLHGYHAYHVIGSAASRERFEVELTEQVLQFTIQERFEGIL